MHRTNHLYWSLALLCACGEPAAPYQDLLDEAGDAAAQAAAPRRPFPQHSTYAAGTIRPNQVSQAQLDREVRSFHAAWKARYLRSVPNLTPVQKYVFYNREGHSDPQSAVSSSEGHGYGMLISALMAGADPAAQADFDALYRFYRAHPSHIDRSLMAWQQQRRGDVISDSSGADAATDGDMDIAYALLLADAQWGSTGAIDYAAAARAVLQGIQRSEVHRGEFVLKLGDWAEDGDSKYGRATRSSDFMLGHLQVFARADAARAAAWRKVYDVTAGIIDAQRQTPQSAATGLLPDFFVKDNGRFAPAPARFLEGAHDGDYDYNACRVPWRLGADALFGGAAARPLLETQTRWIRQLTGDDPAKIRAGYHVRGGTPGEAYVDYGDLAFTAPFLVSASLRAQDQPWLNALWTHVTRDYPISQQAYYGNTIKLLVMITASGNFWQPR